LKREDRRLWQSVGILSRWLFRGNHISPEIKGWVKFHQAKRKEMCPRKMKWHMEGVNARGRHCVWKARRQPRGLGRKSWELTGVRAHRTWNHAKVANI
jgi:hypothetical protein